MMTTRHYVSDERQMDSKASSGRHKLGVTLSEDIDPHIISWGCSCGKVGEIWPPTPCRRLTCPCRREREDGKYA